MIFWPLVNLFLILLFLILSILSLCTSPSQYQNGPGLILNMNAYFELIKLKRRESILTRKHFCWLKVSDGYPSFHNRGLKAGSEVTFMNPSIRPPRDQGHNPGVVSGGVSSDHCPACCPLVITTGVCPPCPARITKGQSQWSVPHTNMGPDLYQGRSIRTLVQWSVRF